MHDIDSDDTLSGASAVVGDGDKYIVPALERGLRLLGEFGRDSRTLSAPELARRLDLPRSTVFRLLNTLESMNFIERAGSGNDYRLGLAVLRLGFGYLASLELTDLGQPVINRLCDDIRHACNLVVRDGRSIVYVARTSPPTPFASGVHVGTRLPAHATVLGRVLLQDLSLPELRALFPEEHLEVFSGSTPQTVLELFDLVETDRQRGYVMGEGFYEATISSVAAPVRDVSGRVIAALGTTIPSDHIDPDRIADLVRRVKASADELSALLNYHPQTVDAENVVALRARQGGRR